MRCKGWMRGCGCPRCEARDERQLQRLEENEARRAEMLRFITAPYDQELDGFAYPLPEGPTSEELSGAWGELMSRDAQAFLAEPETRRQAEFVAWCRENGRV